MAKSFTVNAPLSAFAMPFSAANLRPGESRRVSIPLDDRAFSYYDVNTGAFEVEGGEYTVIVAASSLDEKLWARVEVEGITPEYDGLVRLFLLISI